MYDVKFVKEHSREIKDDMGKRGSLFRAELVDDIVASYDKWLKYKKEIELLRHKRNTISQEINRLQKVGKSVAEKVREVKELPERIKEKEKTMDAAESWLKKQLLQIPNIMHQKVPAGKDAKDNKVLRKWGTIKKTSFPLLSHVDLLEKWRLADFETARKTSGQGFNFLHNEMALLDLALQQYGLDFARKKGFKPVIPPMFLRYATLAGILNGLGDFEEVVYKIQDEDAYLIGTAEHSLVAMLTGKTLQQKDLPIKVCAVTPCFRKEIGAHGVDTKGLFRMHQFNKVEQVVFCSAEDSFKQMEDMQAITEKFFQSLHIPYRVVEICAGDLGAKFARQYDIEAWFPRQKAYCEVTSAGNCTDYQARSLNIQYTNEKGQKTYAHILNNTMVATSRAMVAIIENFQQKNGTVKVPTVLQKYTNGIKKIGRT